MILSHTALCRLTFAYLSQIWCKDLKPLVRFMHFQNQRHRPSWIVNKFKILSASMDQSGLGHYNAEFLIAGTIVEI